MSALLIILFCLMGCGKPQIQVANQSGLVLEDVRVVFPSQRENYGTIQPHSVTGYREIEVAYGHAYIEAMVNGERGVLQPIDYVGDKLLGGGRYTYALSVNEKATSELDRLRFTFLHD